MAQKVHIELVDDIDGSTAVETVPFAVDGRSYEIDLNKKNADKLRKSLAAFVEGARRVSSRASRPKSGSSTKEIREWAKANGYEVSDRGQIPAEIREAYANR